MPYLTPRQTEALAAYARLGSQSEAAHEMGIQISTYKNMLTTIYAKLRSGGAVNSFRMLGWLRVPDEDVLVLAGITGSLDEVGEKLDQLGEKLDRLRAR